MIIHYWKYPFLKPIHEELNKFAGGIMFTDLLLKDNEYLKEAKNRISIIRSDANPEPYKNIREPVIVFYLALCLAISSQDDLLRLKFIEKEAKTVEKELLNEKEESLADLASFVFDTKVLVEIKSEWRVVNNKKLLVRFVFSMPLDAFTRVIKETKRIEELYSQDAKIIGSKVYLTKNELAKLLVYKIMDILYEMVYGEKLGEIKANCLMSRTNLSNG